jgi:hypothetical protein
MRQQTIRYYRDPHETRLDAIRNVCEILACLAFMAFFAVMFVRGLVEDDPFYRTDNDAHYQRIADLCPNLSGQDQIDCYTWLRKGGQHD